MVFFLYSFVRCRRGASSSILRLRLASGRGIPAFPSHSFRIHSAFIYFFIPYATTHKGRIRSRDRVAAVSVIHLFNVYCVPCSFINGTPSTEFPPWGEKVSAHDGGPLESRSGRQIPPTQAAADGVGGRRRRQQRTDRPFASASDLSRRPAPT